MWHYNCLWILKGSDRSSKVSSVRNVLIDRLLWGDLRRSHGLKLNCTLRHCSGLWSPWGVICGYVAKPPPACLWVRREHDVTQQHSCTLGGCSDVVVEYRTRNRKVAGSTHTRSTASNLEQVANLLCAQVNSASYPQRDGKWIVATATGWRPSVADWGDVVSASCTVGPIVR